MWGLWGRIGRDFSSIGYPGRIRKSSRRATVHFHHSARAAAGKFRFRQADQGVAADIGGRLPRVQVTFLSRNHAAFLLIPSEIVRKIRAFAAIGPQARS
jgi:hypothetical protein